MKIGLGSSFLDVQYARCSIDALDSPKVRPVGKVKLIASPNVGFLSWVRVAVEGIPLGAPMRAHEA